MIEKFLFFAAKHLLEEFIEVLADELGGTEINRAILFQNLRERAGNNLPSIGEDVRNDMEEDPSCDTENSTLWEDINGWLDIFT